MRSGEQGTGEVTFLNHWDLSLHYHEVIINFQATLKI